MITKVKEKLEPTNFSGSEHTYKDVKRQLEERLGKDIANEYNAYENMRTFKSWLSAGYVVQKSSKSFSSVVMVTKKDKKGKVISTFPKRIALFHISQVKKVE